MALSLRLLVLEREQRRKERRRLEEVLEWRRRRPIHIGTVVVIIIASHNHLHSKQPISPSYLFRTYGYKGPPPSLPSFLLPSSCLPVAAFPFPACAYQAGALSAAILQTRHLKLAMVLSLSLALSRSMGPQPINLDSNARIFGAVIERESQSHRPFPSPILLLLRSSANNCMHPERGRARERQGIFSREKRSSGWGFHSPRHRVKRKCIHERRRRRHVAVRRVDLCFVRISLSISSLDIIASLFLSLSFATILGCRCCGCHWMRSPPLPPPHSPTEKPFSAAAATAVLCR